MFGFIGFRTLIEALEPGSRVRGIVRKASQIDELKRAIAVKDLTAQNAFDDLAKNVTYICHIASPMPFPVFVFP